MIRKIVEYVAADRELAWATLTDLDNGADETTAWSRANARAEAAEAEACSCRAMPVADRLAGLVNRRLWLRVQVGEEQGTAP